MNKEDRIRSHCHCTSELVRPVIATGEPNPYIPGPKTLQSIMLQDFISFLAHLNLKAKTKFAHYRQNLLTETLITFAKGKKKGSKKGKKS